MGTKRNGEHGSVRSSLDTLGAEDTFPPIFHELRTQLEGAGEGGSLFSAEPSYVNSWVTDKGGPASEGDYGVQAGVEKG